MKLDPLREVEEGPATDVDFISQGAESDGGGSVGLGGDAALARIKAGFGGVYDGALQDVEQVLLDLDEHEGSTLVDGDEAGVMQGVKTMDMEITDDEDSSTEPAQMGGGVKRKRTIRLIIRSRAFL